MNIENLATFADPKSTTTNATQHSIKELFDPQPARSELKTPFICFVSSTTYRKMPKERGFNPVQAQRKAEKAKAIKKGTVCVLFYSQIYVAQPEF